MKARSVNSDLILNCLENLHAMLEERGIWHCLAFKTLLGALRQRDFIPATSGFECLVKPKDARRIIALNHEISDDGLEFRPVAGDAAWLDINVRNISSLYVPSISVLDHGEEVGELLIFSLFKDGILRQFDFETELYWAPQHSFPHFFLESSGAVKIAGQSYPAPRCPEKWLEGIYGTGWQVQPESVVTGDGPMPETTGEGESIVPKLAEQVAWCLEQGWNRESFRHERSWPRTIRAVGSGRSKGRRQWRDLGALSLHY